MAVLTQEMKTKIQELFPRYPNKQALTLPALHLVNEARHCVPPEAVAEIAELLELALQRAGISRVAFDPLFGDRFGNVCPRHLLIHTVHAHDVRHTLIEAECGS